MVRHWRAGLLRSRAWSLVESDGRGGQEGSAPWLPVGGLKRGARADGRWGGQGGARSAETAPLLRVPALHLSTRPHSLWVLGGVRAPQFTGLCALSWGKAKRRFSRAQGPGDLGDSVGASPPAPGRTPPAVLRASGPRDDPGQCIGGAQGPGERGRSAATPPGCCQRAGSGGLHSAPPSSPGI